MGKRKASDDNGGRRKRGRTDNIFVGAAGRNALMKQYEKYMNYVERRYRDIRRINNDLETRPKTRADGQAYFVELALGDSSTGYHTYNYGKLNNAHVVDLLSQVTKQGRYPPWAMNLGFYDARNIPQDVSCPLIDQKSGKRAFGIREIIHVANDKHYQKFNASFVKT